MRVHRLQREKTSCRRVARWEDGRVNAELPEDPERQTVITVVSNLFMGLEGSHAAASECIVVVVAAAPDQLVRGVV